ncbi:hypothetical protein PUNSTDRAFT_146704 [Punctularia strigosozonata HHB-11173 SS5]|uniref:Uncharacterized protein n=1 Tax=Punctularia strigosozonata (strain HHB-11173) TaxID=741275 RepID=R7S127_PUNST|nr:uncharacterized protein PUNSTDRAFT_146704 [Punctularia strigosozonata HHB-11173 SS5]EIN03923.1 hypothetical protein PUNSTDRAFT_146704 [Punctularia strigosozonata HHB-11173 SS5]
MAPDDDEDVAVYVPAGPLTLPPELILHILALAPVTDGIRLLLTCRSLSLHLSDPSESLWIAYCARYDLRSVAHFPSRSFRTVYAGLLHPYAWLLGAWANDAPFRGNVLHFRLDLGSTHEPGGIVGEVWCFPRPGDDPDDSDDDDDDFDLSHPEPPLLQRVLKIAFSDPCDEDATPCTENSKATMYCHLPDLELSHPCRLHIRRAPPQPRTLQFPIRTPAGATLTYPIQHPAFPPHASSPWIDHSRPLPPSLASVPTSDYDDDALLSFSIACPSSVCTPYHQPPALTLLPESARYYPLSSTPHPSGDPRSPDTLSGLWLGAYGPHGTELLHLSHSPDGVLSAHKIVGDQNVPRGVETWSAYLASGPLAPPVRIPDHPELDDDRCAVYEGSGRVSITGFLDQEDYLPAYIAIRDADTIDVWWGPLGMMSRCVRFKGQFREKK